MPDNISVVRSAVEAFNTGHADGVKKAFHRDIEKGAVESLRSVRGAFPARSITYRRTVIR
jgi:hypothetical protein